MKNRLVLFLFMVFTFHIQAQQELDSCDMLIQQGYSLMLQNRLLSAKNTYERACFSCSEKCPTEKIQEAEKRLLQSDSGCRFDSQYPKILMKADEYFDGKQFERAKEFYSRAAILKPSDSYPKERIKQIDRILSGEEK